jgi:hypothetical protein
MSKQAIRPFDEILRTINNGQLVDDLTDEMTEVISAIRSTGKAGKISVTLNLFPRGSDNTQMEVRPSIKGTAPEMERRISLFYVNADDGLQRDDPLQNQLPGIQTVVDATDKIDTETGEVLSK